MLRVATAKSKTHSTLNVSTMLGLNKWLDSLDFRGAFVNMMAGNDRIESS